MDPTKRKYIAIILLIAGALLIGMRFDMVESLLSGNFQFSVKNIFAIISPIISIGLGLSLLVKKD